MHATCNILLVDDALQSQSTASFSSIKPSTDKTLQEKTISGVSLLGRISQHEPATFSQSHSFHVSLMTHMCDRFRQDVRHVVGRNLVRLDLLYGEVIDHTNVFCALLTGLRVKSFNQALSPDINLLGEHFGLRGRFNAAGARAEAAVARLFL